MKKLQKVLSLSAALFATATIATVKVFSAKTVSGNGWMRNLTDEMQISQVNIPGSHDAGTFNLDIDTPLSPLYAWGMRLVLSTQSLDIREQLKCGIRLFDIRVNSVEVDGKYDLAVFHGPMNGREKNGSVLTFNKVISACEEFLSENKEEFVILMYNDEDTRTEEWKKLEEDLISRFGSDENKLILSPEFTGKYDEDGERVTGDSAAVLPTVGECRGKILLLEAHQILKWEDNDDCKPCKKTAFLDEAFSRHEKQRTGTALPIIKSTEDGLPSPKLIFSSTYNSGLFSIPVPRLAASYINPYLNAFDFEEGENYGWVFLNFSNEETAAKIYGANFTAEAAGEDSSPKIMRNPVVTLIGDGKFGYILIGAVSAAVISAAVVKIARKRKKNK